MEIRNFFNTIEFLPFQVLEEFYNIFGPELKAVTGDPERIEEVLLRVDKLVEPIEQVCTKTFTYVSIHAFDTFCLSLVLFVSIC